jgi:hypothetical protein
MTELEKELQSARKVYVEAIDKGDVKTENEYADIIDIIAKTINGKNKQNFQQWYVDNEHVIENLECPKEIINEVREFAKHPMGFNKDIVENWNQYLDFDLHNKLKTYGMVGAARLNKIFKLK